MQGYELTSGLKYKNKDLHRCVSISVDGLSKISNCSNTVLEEGDISIVSDTVNTTSPRATCQKCYDGFILKISSDSNKPISECVRDSSSARISNCSQQYLLGYKTVCKMCNLG